MEFQWELMVFTLFISFGAGILSIQGLLAFVGKGARFQMVALIASLAAVVIGGIASFLHLEHWDRIFQGFGHLSSGITQELIAIVVFIVVVAVYFIMLRRSESGQVPKWCALMAMLMGVILVVIMANSYNMTSRPIWNTPLLWLYYLGNAAFFGSLFITLLSGIYERKAVSEAQGSDGSVAFSLLLSRITGVVQLAITGIYAIFFALSSGVFASVGSYFDSVNPTRPNTDPDAIIMSVFTGEYALLFWLGAVVVGLLLPLVLVMVTKKNSKQFVVITSVSLLCALAGGLFFRAILYVLGFSVFMFY